MPQSVVRLFGVEVVKLWTAVLLRKRVVVYCPVLADLLRLTRTLPQLCWHRHVRDRACVRACNATPACASKFHACARARVCMFVHVCVCVRMCACVRVCVTTCARGDCRLPRQDWSVVRPWVTGSRAELEDLATAGVFIAGVCAAAGAMLCSLAAGAAPRARDWLAASSLCVRAPAA